MDEDNRENNNLNSSDTDDLLFLNKAGAAIGRYAKNAAIKAKKAYIAVRGKLEPFNAAVATATKKIAQNAFESVKKTANFISGTLWPKLRLWLTAAAKAAAKFFAKVGKYLSGTIWPKLRLWLTAAAKATGEFFTDVGKYISELFSSVEGYDETELPDDTQRKKRMRLQALLLAIMMLCSVLLPSLARANLSDVFAAHDSSFYCEKADKMLNAGKPEKALRYIKKAEAKAESTDYAQICTVKAQYEFYMGNTDEGLKFLEQYLKLMPDDDASRAYIAQYYVTYGYYNEALIHYSVLIKHGYNASEVYYLKGVCAMNAQKYSTAEEAFTQALAQNSEQNEIYYYRGVCRMQLGNYEEASEDFTKQLELNSSDEQNLRYLRGLCYLALEQGEAAYTDLSFAANGADAELSSKAKVMLSEYFF